MHRYVVHIQITYSDLNVTKMGRKKKQMQLCLEGLQRWGVYIYICVCVHICTYLCMSVSILRFKASLDISIIPYS